MYKAPGNRIFSFAIGALALLVVGCGSNDASLPANVPGATARSDDFFMGRVLLNRFVAGATVTILDSKGNPIYRDLTTDNNGLFYAYGSLPANFRIEARRDGEATVSVREVRGGYDGGTMYLNPLYTLAARHIQAHPGMTLEQAEADVRTYFSMPSGYNFNWITNSRVSPFSPKHFYELAEANGGPDAFYRRVSQELEGGLQRGLVLTEEPDSTALKFVKTVANDLLGDTVSVIDAGIFGAVTQALGFNLGTTGALNEIKGQLNTIQQGINDIERELNLSSLTGDYNTDRGAMLDSLNDLNTSTNTIKDGIQNPGANLNNLVAAISANNVTNDSTIIAEYLLGDNVDNIVFTYAQLQMAGLGISSTDSVKFQGYPVRNNTMTRKLRQNLECYLQYLALAANLHAEYAHQQLPFAPAGRNAFTQIDRLAARTQQARAQVPDDLSSDEILVDQEKGQMWILSFQAQANYDTASRVANGFEVGGVKNWGLASRQALSDFVQNRVGKLVTDQDSDSQWKAAFQAFGFDLTYYGEQHYAETGTIHNSDKQGQSFYFLEKSTFNQQNVYQWQGVPFNPATSYYYVQPGAPSTSTYLIYRTYANPSVEATFPDAFATGQLINNTPLNVTSSGNQLKATTKLDLKGVPSKDLDVTNRCYWSSSDNSVATVSNFAGNDTGSSGPNLGPVGQINWHPPVNGSSLNTPVTFTARYWAGASGGASGNAPLGLNSVTNTITVTPSGVAPAVFGSLQVLPYRFTTDVVVKDATQLFYATSFYNDGQFHDVTNDTTFKLYNSSNQLVNSTVHGGFVDSVANNLVLKTGGSSAGTPPGTYTVNATYSRPTGGNVTSSVTVVVNGSP